MLSNSEASRGGGVRSGAPAASSFRRLSALLAAASIWTLSISQAALAQGASPTPPASGQAKSQPPEASANDIDGETMFATLCGFCHEDGGRTAGKGPKLAGTRRSDEFIINRIKMGKPGAMPAFGRVFSDGQIIAILAYIRGLEE
jgi:mono/diheme cytochrome c family protein